MKITTTIEGITKTQGSIKKLEKVSTQALIQALYLEGERVMTDAKENYVPVLTGALQGSGRVQQPRPMGNGKWEIRLTFGGPAAAYALEVHERDPKIGQGKNKYLQKPFRASIPKLESRLNAWMKVFKTP
jgi:hypothetical protein